uniref:Uncharacterized protein n=1 Tax=Quercus lobata TaxID=97700 RepID=A0A7N2L745_QUELO
MDLEKRRKTEVTVERRIDLVYGGGSVGLMGLVSQAVHDGGRHVLGFMIVVFTSTPDKESDKYYLGPAPLEEMARLALGTRMII